MLHLAENGADQGTKTSVSARRSCARTGWASITKRQRSTRSTRWVATRPPPMRCISWTGSGNSVSMKSPSGFAKGVQEIPQPRRTDARGGPARRSWLPHPPGNPEADRRPPAVAALPGARRRDRVTKVTEPRADTLLSFLSRCHAVLMIQKRTTITDLLSFCHAVTRC